ncbi:hypothetical protein L083_7497 [Actinoplanes sp. N902-109]|nr:hypothetical protein L083_7497 [Actinoplanes sp. N902-109]
MSVLLRSVRKIPRCATRRSRKVYGSQTLGDRLPESGGDRAR